MKKFIKLSILPIATSFLFSGCYVYQSAYVTPAPYYSYSYAPAPVVYSPVIYDSFFMYRSGGRDYGRHHHHRDRGRYR